MDKLFGIYGIIHGLAMDNALEKRLLFLFKHGLNVLQYREKSGDFEQRYAMAMQLKQLCDAHDVILIINDDVMLAQLIHADGVHLGQHDLSILKARNLLGPDKIIGATCNANIEVAKAAIQNGANYCAFGAFFPTATKQDATLAPLSILSQAKHLPSKIAAIGGINHTNLQQVLSFRPDLIVMAHALFHPSKTDIIQQIFNAWEVHCGTA